MPRPAWVLFGGTFINRFGSFVLPFLVLYLTRRGYSVIQAGTALSLYGFGSVAAAAVGGQLADRLGRRATIALSMFSSASTMLALSQAASLPRIVVLSGLAGFTAELYRPAAAALITDLTPAGQRVTAFALYRLAVHVGLAAGPAVAGFVAERSFFLLFMGDALTSVVFGCVALAALPTEARRGRDHLGSARALPTMIADRVFMRLLLASVAVAFVFNQAYSTFPLHLRASDLSSPVYGALMSLNALLIILLELPLTSIAQHFPPRLVLATGLLLTGVGFGLTGLAHTVPLLAVIVLIWSVGEIVFLPVATAHVADIAPHDMRARYQAAFNLAFSVGFMLAPVAGTALFAAGPHLLWSTCLILGVGASVLMLSIPTGTIGATNAASGGSASGGSP